MALLEIGKNGFRGTEIHTGKAYGKQRSLCNWNNSVFLNIPTSIKVAELSRLYAGSELLFH